MSCRPLSADPLIVMEDWSDCLDVAVQIARRAGQVTPFGSFITNTTDYRDARADLSSSGSDPDASSASAAGYSGVCSRIENRAFHVAAVIINN